MYFVIDLYEGFELIGTYDTYSEAKRAALQRVEDTDGECMVDWYSTRRKDDCKRLKEWGLI